MTFPSSLQYLGQNCFSNAGLESAKFTDSQIREQILDIHPYAFSGCLSLKNLILPSHTTKIGHRAFIKTGLEQIVIPPNVVELGKTCFAKSKNLRTVDIQADIRYIEDSLFFECEQLHTVTLPQSVIQKKCFIGQLK